MEDGLVTLSGQVTALEQCSSLLLDIQHRFLSVYIPRQEINMKSVIRQILLVSRRFGQLQAIETRVGLYK